MRLCHSCFRVLFPQKWGKKIRFGEERQKENSADLGHWPSSVATQGSGQHHQGLHQHSPVPCPANVCFAWVND